VGKCSKIFVGVFSLFLIMIIFLSPAIALQNATRQDVTEKNCAQRFARGTIYWTNPNLNTTYGGVYNRIALVNSAAASPIQHAGAFVEVGWYKEILFGGLVTRQGSRVVYTDASGTPQTIAPVTTLPPYPVYSIQYDPVNTNQWHFYRDGIGLGSTVSHNLSGGCAVVAGGEVVSHVEDMGYTSFLQLEKGKIDAFGIIKNKYWTSNTIRLFQGRYSCTYLSNNNHICGP
jgi:hypothetical protein